MAIWLLQSVGSGSENRLECVNGARDHDVIHSLFHVIVQIENHPCCLSICCAYRATSFYCLHLSLKIKHSFYPPHSTLISLVIMLVELPGFLKVKGHPQGAQFWNNSAPVSLSLQRTATIELLNDAGAPPTSTLCTSAEGLPSLPLKHS